MLKRLCSQYKVQMRVNRGLVWMAVVACVGWSSAHAASVVEGDDQVVASRGGVNVTLAEVDARVMELPPQMRAEYLNDPARIEETIESLLLNKQLAAKAYELGAGGDPYLALQLEQARDRFLASRARTLNEQNIEVPDFTELAEEAYLANPDKYSSKETLELTHILVSDKGRDDAAARQRAEEAHALAVSGKRDFASLVAEYSDEESRGVKSTGKLSGVTRGAMVAEFEAAAFELKNPGDISGVVKTKYGYHVIQLNARAAPERIPYETVKARIIDELRKNYVNAQKAHLSESLRGMKIEATPDVVASLRQRYTADGPKGKRIASSSISPGASAAAD